MAILIDSLEKLDISIRRKFKKLFLCLDDRFIIRTPAIEKLEAAQILVEGPKQSWLMLAYHPSISNTQEVTKFLNFNKIQSKLDFKKIHYIAVVDTIDLSTDLDLLKYHNISVIEKQTFFDTGHNLITSKLTVTTLAQHQWIKKKIFSESVINSACTTRRNPLSRDNNSQLEEYFLDYNQEIATKMDLFHEPPHSVDKINHDFSIRLLNGVAGCGKTLILINRAILYCKLNPKKKALLLIHNKPITTDIKYKFTQYLGGIPANLTINTFHSFALSQQSKIFGRTKPLFSDLETLIHIIFSENNISSNPLNISEEQLALEFEYINNYLIDNEEIYLSFERQGRGFSLQQSQRRIVWRLYKNTMQHLSSIKNGYLPSLYIKELCLSQKNFIKLRKYHHILIDEAQFFFPSWLQLVSKSLVEQGMLYLCADPNQGFLKSRLSWKSVGFNVRGRTKKLDQSYRTTHEIMTAANALLGGLRESSDDFIKPDFSKMEHGSKPKVIYSTTPQDEQKRFLNEMKTCINEGGIPLHQVMVLCGGNTVPWRIKNSVNQVLGGNVIVNCNDRNDLSDNYGNRIKLMSIESCTGMESGITFVLGVGELLNKENNLDFNQDEREICREESIRKLYVAMTRAGQKLILFSTETLPERVKEYIDVV